MQATDMKWSYVEAVSVTPIIISMIAKSLFHLLSCKGAHKLAHAKNAFVKKSVVSVQTYEGLLVVLTADKNLHSADLEVELRIRAV
jgi:hypothetical protein